VLQDAQLAVPVPKRFWLAKTGVDPRLNWCPSMDQTKWLVDFHFLIEFLILRADFTQFDADDEVNWIDFQKAILSGLATSGIRTLEDWTEFKVLVGAVSKLMEAAFRPFIVQMQCDPGLFQMRCRILAANYYAAEAVIVYGKFDWGSGAPYHRRLSSCSPFICGITR
jgi:hypothetical protein